MAIMLVLRGLTGEYRGKELVFPEPSHLLLGRSRSCQVHLSVDGTVSRQHCLIEVDKDGVWVQDLGSLNGTHVNGQKIGQREKDHQTDATMLAPPRQELQDGDELRICNNVFAVCLEESFQTYPKPTINESSGHFNTAMSH